MDTEEKRIYHEEIARSIKLVQSERLKSSHGEALVKIALGTQKSASSKPRARRKRSAEYRHQQNMVRHRRQHLLKSHNDNCALEVDSEQLEETVTLKSQHGCDPILKEVLNCATPAHSAAVFERIDATQAVSTSNSRNWQCETISIQPAAAQPDTSIFALDATARDTDVGLEAIHSEMSESIIGAFSGAQIELATSNPSPLPSLTPLNLESSGGAPDTHHNGLSAQSLGKIEELPHMVKLTSKRSVEHVALQSQRFSSYLSQRNLEWVQIGVVRCKLCGKERNLRSDAVAATDRIESWKHELNGCVEASLKECKGLLGLGTKFQTAVDAGAYKGSGEAPFEIIGSSIHHRQCERTTRHPTAVCEWCRGLTRLSVIKKRVQTGTPEHSSKYCNIRFRTTVEV